MSLPEGCRARKGTRWLRNEVLTLCYIQSECGEVWVGGASRGQRGLA